MLLLGGVVEARTYPDAPLVMFSVTASWMELTKLAMMKAVATGARTAAAMVAVRPGSRTRLARPSRTGAPRRGRVRRIKERIPGAEAPPAITKAAAARPVPA